MWHDCRSICWVWHGVCFLDVFTYVQHLHPTLRLGCACLPLTHLFGIVISDSWEHVAQSQTSSWMCCQALRISTMNFGLLNSNTRLQWQSCYWVERIDSFFNLTEECRSVLFSQLFYSSNHLGHFQDILGGSNINRVFMVFCFGCFVTYLSVIRTIMQMEHQ